MSLLWSVDDLYSWLLNFFLWLLLFFLHFLGFIHVFWHHLCHFFRWIFKLINVIILNMIIFNSYFTLFFGSRFFAFKLHRFLLSSILVGHWHLDASSFANHMDTVIQWILSVHVIMFWRIALVQILWRIKESFLIWEPHLHIFIFPSGRRIFVLRIRTIGLFESI